MVHRVFRDCWLLFGGVDDIGYSHSLNLGRLDINRGLQAKYPENQYDYTFESYAYPGVFFMPPEERAALVNQSIADGCNVILAASTGLLDEFAYALQFPNISFVGAAGAVFWDPSTMPRNLLQYTVDWLGAAFVSGVVAASNSDTCGAFLNAFEARRSTWAHAMGFVLGYQWLKPHQPVYVVTMDSYFSPDAEVLAARQMVEVKGCDVISRHTDPNSVDKYINSLSGFSAAGGKRKALSIARYVDMSTFVGDTVFTSQVWDPYEMGFPVIEDAFLGVMAAHQGNTTREHIGYFSEHVFTNATTGIADGTGIQRMSLSPFTSAVNQTSAAALEQLAWDYLDNNNPLCDMRWRTTGQLLAPSPSCLDHKTLQLPEAYLLLPNVTYYDAFQDGGTVCGGGGKYYTYDADNLTVTCHLCPQNTYRSAEDRAGETCVPCPDGTHSDPGSSQCTRETTTSTVNTAALVSSIVAVLVIVALSSFIVLRIIRRRRDNTHAPKQPHKVPIAILFTDIQASTTLWANEPQEMSKAIEAHHALLRKIIHKHKGYEVKTIGDAFMVVHQDIFQAVAIALDIQRDLYNYDWGTDKIDKVYAGMAIEEGDDEDNLTFSLSDQKVWNGLRIRVGVAYGNCDGQRDPISHGWDYYGTTVNTAARTEAAAHGGQVLLTGPAYQALVSRGNRNIEKNKNASMETTQMSVTETSVPLPEETENGLGIESVKSHGLVTLRGLAEQVELLQVTPAGFGDRQFPPLRVEEDEVESATREAAFDSDPSAALSSTLSKAALGDDILRVDAEERMDRLMKICMRTAGVRRYDSTLMETSWNIYFGMNAMLSLHSANDRAHLLNDLVKKWHLSVPHIRDSVLHEIGEQMPMMLILSIRSATVVLAERRSLLVFQSMQPTSSRKLIDQAQEAMEIDQKQQQQQEEGKEDYEPTPFVDNNHNNAEDAMERNTRNDEPSPPKANVSEEQYTKDEPEQAKDFHHHQHDQSNEIVFYNQKKDDDNDNNDDPSNAAFAFNKQQNDDED